MSDDDRGRQETASENLQIDGLTPEAADALTKLQELDRILPRSLEEWVADRDRDGLQVPEILKSRLAEKERLRQIYRQG